jgi:hypothetical protein
MIRMCHILYNFHSFSSSIVPYLLPLPFHGNECGTKKGKETENIKIYYETTALYSEDDFKEENH